MNSVVYSATTMLDVGVAASPKPGQTVCGDIHWIKTWDHHALIAVVDGVGHGEEAVAAANAAIGVIKVDFDQPLTTLFQKSHRALAGMRGVVMTLARIDAAENSLTWLGVGNVGAHLFRAKSHISHPSESALLRNGMVGFRMPPLQSSTISIASGDVLLFGTDGIRAEFADEINPGSTPQQLANWILLRHFKGNDDALVLVGRYTGLNHD
jgi:negative regulator of sigma-B (phosphoserine phosphatase)